MADESIDELRKIRREDIPDDWKDAYDILGHDLFMRFAELYSGGIVYFPSISKLQRNGRDREIRARFNGSNYRQLAAMFGLTDRQIRKIIDGK